MKELVCQCTPCRVPEKQNKKQKQKQKQKNTYTLPNTCIQHRLCLGVTTDKTLDL